MDDLKGLAHTIQRKATNTIKDIQSGDAAHIIERKATNTLKDVQEFSGTATAAIGDAVNKVAPNLGPQVAKAGDAIKHAAEDVVHKVEGTFDRLTGKAPVATEGEAPKADGPQ